MKRVILILVILFSLAFLFSCELVLSPVDTEPTEGENDPTNPIGGGETDPIVNKDPFDITIFSINDLHGVIFPKGDYAGVSRIGNFLINNSDENTIILSAGDMYQGTAVSSMTRGRAVVDVMNYIGLDALAVGNHEFDWGIEEILKYYDGNTENGEAEFPMLCANCKDLTTGKLASWCVPYTVLERMGIKIGVIGIIGHEQTNSITESFVRNYEFTDELTATKKYSKILHEEEGCDIVILCAHLDTDFMNSSITSLKANERIDAILNGHTHNEYYGFLKHTDGALIPYVQSGCYGSYIGRIDLTYDPVLKKVTDAKVQNHKATTVATIPNENIDDLLVRYQDYIDLANSELGRSASYIDKYTFGKWVASHIATYYDCEVGIVNTGGVRANGFPIRENEMITYDSIFQILPFENTIQIVYLKGIDLRGLLYDSDYYFFNKEVNPSQLTVNGKLIDNDTYYKVVTIDYLYEKSYLPFKLGIDHVNTHELLREVVVDIIKENIKENNKFNVNK